MKIKSHSHFTDMSSHVRVFAIALALATVPTSACADRTTTSTALRAWTVSDVPLLEVNADDSSGLIAIGAAAHVTRLPDGGVLVSDRGLHSLRFFGPDGRFVRSVGRQGPGPGEFEYIRVANRCGDSLFVEDIVSRRVNVYALNGSLKRTLATTVFGGGTEAFSSACNLAGFFVHHAWNRFDPATRGRHRDQVAVWLTSPANRRIADLDSVGGPEFVGLGDGGGRALLGRTPHLAIGRLHAYVGSADGGLITVYNLDGSHAGVRQVPFAEVKTTEEDLERAKRLDTLGQSATEQAQTRQGWTLDTPPSTLPGYDALIVDSADHLWVRRYPVAGDNNTEWIVFSPGGELEARVSLPAVLTVHEIGQNHIAGIVLDPVTGEHAVQVLSLSRSP